MFRPGSIRKIEVKNFVTYSHVELYPGPHLNMLIGPNGTGKSTVVAAVILGLGGNPKIVGRGSRVSEYVKHGCETSTINIYLQDEAENQFIKVTREFDTRERTVWKLDSRIVKFENVLECIQNFSIQVNNLCQFLPQDRVQDFAKMNKQELLKETQKALCRFDLIEKQELLIQNRRRQREILESVDKHQKKLQDATEFNSRLEGRVQSFKKKKKYGENIQHIERKIVWMSYEQLRVQLSETKEDRNKAQEVYDRYKNAMKPIEKTIGESKKSITELQQNNSRVAQIIRNTESSINMNLEKIDTMKDSVRKLNDDMNSRLAEVEQWDKEIESASAKLEEMRTLKTDMFAKCASENKGGGRRTGVQSGTCYFVSNQKCKKYRDIWAGSTNFCNKSKPHEVNLCLTNPMNKWTSVCSCKAGQSGFCKHVVAVLIYISRDEEIEEFSCTAYTQAWGKEKAGIKEIYEAEPTTSFHQSESRIEDNVVFSYKTNQYVTNYLPYIHLYKEAGTSTIVMIISNGDTEKKQTLSTELNKLLGHQKILQDKKEEILQIKQDDTLRMHALENESLRLENVKQNRLQHLGRLSPDAHTAVNWLRNNKHLFRGDIYEPIMLEVNVLEARHAKYVENVIPLRDRLAFTCIYKDDMNKLIKCLREGQNLSVNVIHSEDATESMSKFQPTIAIECLRKYGFYTYINNLFSAPGPIMHYLCKTYRLHNIPLGDQTTNDFYEQVPQQIKQFFSDKYRYSISFSKYSGEKSTRQVEVFSDGGLSLSLDVVKLDKLRGEVLEIKRIIDNHDTKCQSLEKQFDTLREKISAARETIREIQLQKQNAQAVNVRIENLQKKVTEMNQCKKSPENIKEETKFKKKQLLKSMPSTQDIIKKDVSKLVEHVKRSLLTLQKIEQVRKKIAYLENQVNENRRQCQEAEETLNLVKDRYTEVMSQAKAMLNKAKGMSKGFTPADSGFDEFRPEYDSLPSEIQDLNARHEQLLSRIACLNVADDDEMKEYEKKLNQIDELTEDIEKLNANLNKVTEKIETTKQEWLIPLKKLVAEINLQFATAFEKMGCAGEISVCTGDNEQDFSQYGICIKVTYRSGEPLQELNSNIQSGGERAVATAAFMLSLQKLTPVPFRCVDEINQGMDANNERRIFELIVESTCQQTSSQYFLITPKLVPHLKYSPNMFIHIVHNGPFVTQDKKWGFSKLCNYHRLNIG